MQRTLIRDQANALFSKISFAKTSVADIAKACGLGKGTIYLYFKSKDEIINAIIEDRIACIRENSDSFFSDPSVPVEDKVRRFFDELIDEVFALKDLIFGSFDNVEGRMLKDIFFKYGRYNDWCIDRFVEIIRSHEPYSTMPEARLREETRTLIELLLGKTLLFVVARDWNDKEGLKEMTGPLSLRLFRLLLGQGE